MSARAVFLDRDGIINADYGYVGSLERFEFLPGAVGALACMRRKGYLPVVITNQSGIARGLYTEADFLRVTAYMRQILRLHGADVAAIYYCPHHPQAARAVYRRECACRKPRGALFARAVRELDLDPAQSAAGGDHLRDLEPARALGVRGLFLVGGTAADAGRLPGTVCCRDLAAMAASLP